jgi:hypothetical protein
MLFSNGDKQMSVKSWEVSDAFWAIVRYDDCYDSEDARARLQTGCRLHRGIVRKRRFGTGIG